MSEKDDILIDAYLRGMLSAEDKILVENRLEDSNFKQKYDEATSLLHVLKEEDAKKIKSRLQTLEKDQFEKTDSENKPNHLKIGLIILGLMLIATLSYFILIPSDSASQQEIYASYFEPYPNVVDPIVKGGTEALSVYQQYELKDYQKVIQILTSKSSLDPDEQFFLASSYLAVENYDRASTNFEVLKNSKKYADASHWYLALICLKSEKVCDDLFNSIASDKSNIYNKKAAELLNKLRD